MNPISKNKIIFRVCSSYSRTILFPKKNIEKPNRLELMESHIDACHPCKHFRTCIMYQLVRKNMFLLQRYRRSTDTKQNNLHNRYITRPQMSRCEFAYIYWYIVRTKSINCYRTSLADEIGLAALIAWLIMAIIVRITTHTRTHWGRQKHL